MGIFSGKGKPGAPSQKEKERLAKKADKILEEGFGRQLRERAEQVAREKAEKEARKRRK